jgi:capsular polysaccharide transport system permease protein
MKRVWNNLLAFTAAYRGFSWLVLLPTVIVALYYVLVASPVFVSEAHFTVRSQAGGAVTSGLLSGIFGGVSDTIATQDIAIVSDYIQSRDIMQKLDAELGLRPHFSDPQIDFWARMEASDPAEDFLDYYQDKIEVLMNETTGIISLKTKAFNPDTAKAMADQILGYSETLVNDLSKQITRDSVAFAESEMQRAEQRLREAAEKLTEYRNLTNILDPTQKTGAVMGIVTTLESNLAAARAERDQLLSYLRDNSAEVVAVNARIKALEEQVRIENQRLTGKEKVELSAILQDYERYTLDKEIAHQVYTSTLASLETARNEAARKQLYLVTFVRPSRAESAEEPKALWNTATVFVALTLLYILAKLIIATIKDHSGP